jgi:DNA-directed RNA polymerase specialized sigma24 family protein
MATGPESVVREGLRALARALVSGGTDADDRVQDAAVIALEHPPELDRPVRPWLAAALRNRRRMDRRASSRREARELVAAAGEATAPPAEDAIDRARILEPARPAPLVVERRPLKA